MKKTFFFLLFVIFLSKGFSQTFTITTPVTGLNQPVAFVFTPDGRYLLTLKDGFIRMYSPSGTFMNTFYNLSDSTIAAFERGLLGICLDPDYVNNKYVYVYYNHMYNNIQRIRVVRFTEMANLGTNPTIILNISVSSSIPGNHVGGNLRFRPSDPNRIYVSIGDIANSSNSQLRTNPFGKMLRINRDGTIPTDNPYYDDGNPATGNDDRIWTYGHRNHFDHCFSTVNDSLYSSENGAGTQDEVNMVMKGKNYGWNQCEGTSGAACSNPSFTSPMWTIPSPLPSLTGILFYTGTTIPQFNNHLLVADNDYGRIYDLTLGNAPLYNTVTGSTMWMDVTTGSVTGGLTTLMQGSDGCIYAMNGGYTSSGRIFRICPQAIGTNDIQVLDISNSFPNPFTVSSEIKFQTREEGTLTVTLFDAIGKKVTDIISEKKTPGPHTVMIDSQKFNLSPGKYYCLIQLLKTDGTIISGSKELLMVK